MRIYRPAATRVPADRGVRTRRRVCVLRPGQPRRAVSQLGESDSRRCCFGRLPAGAREPLAGSRRRRLRGDPVGSPQCGRARRDATRIVVGGDSAGGNLAAVTAMMARDRGAPAIAAQLLLYPMIAADFDNESYRLYGEGFYNPKPALQWYWDQYVPSPADREHPYASPLSGRSRGLPPAVVVIAGHDPLRDEGIAYADALEAAGVATVRAALRGRHPRIHDDADARPCSASAQGSVRTCGRALRQGSAWLTCSSSTGL